MNPLIAAAVLVSIVLTGCSGAGVRTSTTYALVVKETLTVPGGSARIYFQNGERHDSRPADRRQVTCRVQMRNLQAENSEDLKVISGTVAVSRVRRENDHTNTGATHFFRGTIEEQPGLVVYTTEFRLDAPEQPQWRALICERWTGFLGDYYPTENDVRIALGDHIELQHRP